jgi:hypothetical protein
MMGPTARLIEEKKPTEKILQTIAREIEAAFAAESQFRPDPSAGDHFSRRRTPPGLSAIEVYDASGRRDDIEC